MRELRKSRKCKNYCKNNENLEKHKFELEYYKENEILPFHAYITKIIEIFEFF